MLCSVALLLAFVLPGGTQTSSDMEEGMVLMTRPRGSYVEITCSIQAGKNYVHWYRFQEGQTPRRLLYYDCYKSKAVFDSGLKEGKYDAYEGTGKNCKFIVRNVEESDSDKTFNTDISPKPIMFLPSIAETKLHKAGTYLCLLEKFFPEDIKVSWKEKDGDTILKSLQGDTVKTNDTYMKLSWLTVTGDSMDKEHRCIVKHEKNRGGADQEILFPPVNEAVNFINPREAELKDQNVVTTLSPREASLTDENVVNTTESGTSSKDDLLDLQFSSTSAYYTYLLLLIKSALHGALVTYCLCRRSAVFCDGKSN